MPRPPFPANVGQFQRQFATEAACQQYLTACRWPDGFRCPHCGHARGYAMANYRRWKCAACRYQASLTAGTILHNTKTPLTLWFWAAYLMTTDTRGISALVLQRQLGLRRYETARMLLGKLRRAMVNLARGTTARGDRGGRYLDRRSPAGPPREPPAERAARRAGVGHGREAPREAR